MSEQNGSWRHGAAGVVAIAATYVYFLLFAQFGFLEILARAGAGAAETQRAMAAMGLAGLGASLASPWLLLRMAPRRLLALAFIGCGLSALAAAATYDLVALTAIAALVGAAVALLTVTLAANLRSWVPVRRFGLAVGAGTGLAYGICNLPPLFEAEPGVQSVAVALACLAGLLSLGAMPAGMGEGPPPERPALRERDFRAWGFAGVVVSLLALVWLDSAAFAVIQEQAVLKGFTWGSVEQKMIQGGVHLVAALVAGWAIDRGSFRGLLLSAFTLFAVAFALLGHGVLPEIAGPLYAIGISFYSTALVVYPAYGAEGPGLVPRRWRAAILFGVAGWLGSALGVGMAQDLHRIPTALVVVAGLLLVLAWVLSDLRRARRQVAFVGHAFGIAAAVALSGSLLSVFAAEPPVETAVERGRQVYVEEGCIHCHSQYVRPGTRDVELWGPARPLDRSQRPPLPGNRRQGPDLTHVGLRKPTAWQRYHLIDPRHLNPASRMPSYAHLFEGDGQRGEDLVAYLDSLGRGEVSEEGAAP